MVGRFSTLGISTNQNQCSYQKLLIFEDMIHFKDQRFAALKAVAATAAVFNVTTDQTDRFEIR